MRRPRPSRPAPWPHRGGVLLELLLALLLAPVLVHVGLVRIGKAPAQSELQVGEVGCLVDYAGASTRVITTPGFVPHLPYLRELVPLSRVPLTLRMTGNERVGALQVPRLMVRARDGSTYAFESTIVEFALDAARADLALEDGGAEHGVRAELCQLFARTVLRDELARLSAEEVMESDALRVATEAARTRLAAALAPHGVELLQVSVRGARFSPEYEQAIERREIGEQEIDHLRAQLEQLDKEKLRRVASAEREGELKLAKLRGRLERESIGDRAEDEETRRKADVHHMQRTREATEEAFELSVRTATLEARVAREAAAFEAELARLADAGDVAVREALIERLAEFELSVLPIGSEASEERSKR